MGRNVPLTFTASTWSQSSVLISHTGVSTGPVTPAALTRMSMRPPSVFLVRSTRRCTAASSVTSVGSTSARRPSFSIAPESFSSGATSRAASARCAPSRARATQISAPMPLAAPVTMATRPSRLPAPAGNPALHLRLQNAERHPAVFEQRVVEITQVERCAQRRLGLPPHAQDLELANLVAERLTGPGHVALRLTLRILTRAAEIGDGPFARPALGVEPDVDDETLGPEQLRPQHAEAVVAIAVHAELGAEAFGVERPALAERVVPAKAAKAGQAAVLALQRHLQMMARHGLVQEQVSGDGDAAPLAQGRRVQVEDARARAVERCGDVARRHRALAERLDRTDLEARLWKPPEQPGERRLHGGAEIRVRPEQIFHVRVARGGRLARGGDLGA